MQQFKIKRYLKYKDSNNYLKFKLQIVDVYVNNVQMTGLNPAKH